MNTVVIVHSLFNLAEIESDHYWLSMIHCHASFLPNCFQIIPCDSALLTVTVVGNTKPMNTELSSWFPFYIRIAEDSLNN